MTNPEALLEFWKAMPRGCNIHPQDAPYFDAASRHGFKTTERPPAPWDGPLATAKVIICYANPAFDEKDHEFVPSIRRQLSGREPLPAYNHAWTAWYRSHLGKLGTALEDFRNTISILNLCPYWSREMGTAEWRLAAGLPSVWAAQRHLHEVLLPSALEGKLFLVVARAHQQWGITDRNGCATFRLVRTRFGGLGSLGAQIELWLKGMYP